MYKDYGRFLTTGTKERTKDVSTGMQTQEGVCESVCVFCVGVGWGGGLSQLCKFTPWQSEVYIQKKQKQNKT